MLFNLYGYEYEYGYECEYEYEFTWLSFVYNHYFSISYIVDVCLNCVLS